MTGLEPARHVANAPKAFVSTIPPHRHMVRNVGLEPTRPNEHSDLNAACLPIPAVPHIKTGSCHPF